MKKKHIKDVDVSGKRVLVRVDFNVTLSDGFHITDETRILESLPTIRYLIGSKAKVILISHLDRPQGRIDDRYSLAPVAKRLSQHLKQPVKLIRNFWEKNTQAKINSLAEGEIAMLENIRFHPGEEKNDPNFAKQLASLADIFVNDAFGTSHRAHASIVGIADKLPAFAGFLMEKEINMISMALGKPKRPLVIVVGGAKTPEKIAAIEKLLDIADTILVGGAIANTFLNAWGISTGSSLVNHEMTERAKVVFWKASHKHCAFILPTDVVVLEKRRKAKPKVVAYENVPKNASIRDIGPSTRITYSELIEAAGTVIWNGPMGLFEEEQFRQGTQAIVEAVAATDALTIVGGGDTLASIDKEEYLGKINHLSTGGGALLEFLEKGTLPGIDAIEDA